MAGASGVVDDVESGHPLLAPHGDGGVPGEHGDLTGQGGEQGPLDLGAGGVAAGVDDTGGAVAALAGAGEATAVDVEPGTVARSASTAAGPPPRMSRVAASSTSPPPAARVSATCAATGRR